MQITLPEDNFMSAFLLGYSKLTAYLAYVAALIVSSVPLAMESIKDGKIEPSPFFEQDWVLGVSGVEMLWALSAAVVVLTLVIKILEMRLLSKKLDKYELKKPEAKNHESKHPSESNTL